MSAFDCYIYLCAEVGGQILTFNFLCKKLKILPFYVDNRWGNGPFSRYSTMDLFWFEGIVRGNDEYQEI